MAKNHNYSNARIQTKRDTSANWETNNPVLLNGEEILVDTNAGEIRKKVGNGTKTYTELPFIDEPIRTLIGNKVDKVTGKGLSTEDYTTAEKTKLNGIATSAEVNTINSITLNGLELSITDKQATIPLADDSTYGAVELVKEFGSAQDNISSVVTYEFYANAANAISETLDSIQSTIVTTVATTAANGLMSKDDKTKLNGIATGAEVNQNAFSNIKIGDSTVVADAKTDTVELVAGSNVTITAVDDKITIASTNTQYELATTTANGLMSKDDKIKLNGIATGANNYVHPNAHAATMITEDATHRFVTDTEKSTWNAKASTAVATTTANGLMSKEDKANLDDVLTRLAAVETKIQSAIYYA